MLMHIPAIATLVVVNRHEELAERIVDAKSIAELERAQTQSKTVGPETRSAVAASSIHY